MSRPRTAGLIAATAAEFAARIQPNLSPAERYTGAMLKRALDVLQAEAAAATPPEAALQRACFGTPEALARALRARVELPPSTLRASLRAYVEAKLALSNPRFLQATRDAGKGKI